MKRINYFAVALALMVTACSTSSQVYDDVYYSRKDKNNIAVVTKKNVVPDQTTTAEVISESGDYDYQASYQEGVATKIETQAVEPAYSTTETVTEPDGTTYTTTETYYDSEYAQNFRRFDDDYSGFGYYDSYYTGCLSPGLSLGFGYPFGYGMSFNYGWGGYNPYSYYGYSPYGMNYPFYDPWYSYYPGNYWSGYNHGYYDGYYDGSYGNGYYASGGHSYYGPRDNYSGSSVSARGNRGLLTENKPKGQPYVSGRGVRSGSATDENGTNNTINTNNRGTSTSPREGVNSSPVTNRATRPVNSETRQDPATKISRPAPQSKDARPTSTQKINEYRNKYDRPATKGDSPSGSQRLDRPKTYTSPSVRQPKSSTEYVRPQNESNKNTSTTRPSATENKNRTTTVKSQPARTRSNESYNAPSRSTSTESYSSPSRSYNSNSNNSSSRSSSNSSSNSSSSSSSSRGRR
jgi:hypothetical protein